MRDVLHRRRHALVAGEIGNGRGKGSRANQRAGLLVIDGHAVARDGDVLQPVFHRVQRADLALYEAKRSGRNRVVVAEQS